MKKKYIIAHFVEAFGGGVYTYVKDLSNFLAVNQSIIDCEVHLIYSPNRSELDKELFLKEIHPNIILHELEMQRSVNLIKDSEVISKTRKIFKKIKADILHLHSAKAGVVGRLASFGLISKKNIYYSPHGFSFVQKNISKAKILFFTVIEYVSQFLLGGIIIASGDTEYIISKKVGKSILIRNGIDFELPNKLYSQVNNKDFTVGTVGRLTPQKNPKAFNDIALKLPNVKFIWIGDGELINEITAENIQVTGWVRTREELLKKINTLDLYLQVSLWEGLPIAVLEAMAMRKPLVVSDVIGNRDTVENNFNGYVYKNEEEAINKIKSFIGKDNLLEMGENSYEKAFTEYNKNQNFTNLIDVYKRNTK